MNASENVKSLRLYIHTYFFLVFCHTQVTSSSLKLRFMLKSVAPPPPPQSGDNFLYKKKGAVANLREMSFSWSCFSARCKLNREEISIAPVIQNKLSGIFTNEYMTRCCIFNSSDREFSFYFEINILKLDGKYWKFLKGINIFKL